jgi:hypothetical protein
MLAFHREYQGSIPGQSTYDIYFGQISAGFPDNHHFTSVAFHLLLTTHTARNTPNQTARYHNSRSQSGFSLRLCISQSQ